MKKTTSLAIRTAIKIKYKTDRVILHRDGRVSAYGIMPNSIAIGWFFAGHDMDILSRIHRDAREKNARAPVQA